MNKIFLACFLVIVNIVYSQDVKAKITENIRIIEKALVQKDTIALQNLLHPDLTFGHSNAWIENKESLIFDLKTQKVDYTSFENISDINFTFYSDYYVITRRKINANGKFKQHDFSIKMNVLEVWIFNDNRWVLLARQNVKYSQ